MKQLDYVLSNDKEVLGFLKSKYPMYHLSNVFFRDLHYGIRTMLEKRGVKISYPDGEKIATAFVEKMEKEKIFNRIDQQSWVLNYPEYKKPVVVSASPAKPAAGAAPAKSPAAAGLPPLGSAKPVGATPAAAKPTLPPLSSAKPAGGAKPALPPLASAKPVVAASPQVQAEANATKAEVVEQAKEVVAQAPKAETEKAEVVQPANTAASAAAPPGQRKPLPPLKGNYTPAGKK